MGSWIHALFQGNVQYNGLRYQVKTLDIVKSQTVQNRFDNFVELHKQGDERRRICGPSSFSETKGMWVNPPLLPQHAFL